MKHQPIIQSLDLATNEAVGDAWEQFFLACWDAWELLQQRRAERERNPPTTQELPVQENS